MTSIAIKDLKKPKELRETLEREREVMVTKDGKPFAIMVSVDPNGAEDTLYDLRRIMFSMAVQKARRRSIEHPLSPLEIEEEIKAARKTRTS